MKSLVGKVVSDSMEKTVVVEVERYWKHPLYKKRVLKTSRIKAHCESQDIKKGDRVEIVSTKPYSKEKHFKVAKKINK